MVEQKIKIIVVDDEASVRDVIGSYFTVKGFEVFTAESGEKALPIIIEKKPEIMLLDLNLIGMTGLELLKLVREFNKTIKTIMITGSDISFKDDPRVQQLNITDFIQKPVTVSKLKEAVKKALEP
ncbi:MAG: hypothetical protein COV72_07200 [Candidatus Omnitrophica bacterium CG11_big_fil_rev_8_21_14_0_20_42_13]|uniref:Response regulatory domain-containing protein n=1 Tax=Candidatus Ghiorseimicrobium undicola TaxID=1974746 RepID=A0A2H0LWG9_9BACT|nr:MAG: hypothetical protein COV72_07200 [Candidatus Omnitrophica bacterium CG11_big_fil_rev_8_21_14_0_20_42_13]